MISKKDCLTVLTLLVVSLFFTGCPTDVKLDTSIELSRLGRVYTAGYSTGVMRAYYWVDDTLRTIADADEGSRAACVVPTNFGDYVAGARKDPDDFLIDRAVLWFNGTGDFLDDSPSFAFSAVLHDGKLFAAGWRNPDGSGDRPCVWEVRDSWTIVDSGYVVSSREIIRHDLPTDGGFGAARDIASDGSDQYVCGYYWDEGIRHACYWKNDERVDLVEGNGSWAESLCVDEGKVYVGGKSASYACYWIDGNIYEFEDTTEFPTGASDFIVTAVSVDAGELHLGGSYYKGDYLGFKWNAGTFTTSYPPVIGIGSRGTDVFLGCEECWIKNNDDTPLQWIGGTVRPRGIRMRLY